MKLKNILLMLSFLLLFSATSVSNRSVPLPFPGVSADKDGNLSASIPLEIANKGKFGPELSIHFSGSGNGSGKDH